MLNLSTLLIRIEELSDEKESVMNLLLMGDESEEMIGKYLFSGRMYVGRIGDEIVAECVVEEQSDSIVEIKNLAVLPEMRSRGIGRLMLEYVESCYSGKRIILGTGETPSTLRFYKSCGYVYSHRIPDFFTDNYDHPIIEEGVRLRDMIYLEKKRDEKE